MAAIIPGAGHRMMSARRGSRLSAVCESPLQTLNKAGCLYSVTMSITTASDPKADIDPMGRPSCLDVLKALLTANIAVVLEEGVLIQRFVYFRRPLSKTCSMCI